MATCLSSPVTSLTPGSLQGRHGLVCAWPASEELAMRDRGWCPLHTGGGRAASPGSSLATWEFVSMVWLGRRCRYQGSCSGHGDAQAHGGLTSHRPSLGQLCP